MYNGKVNDPRYHNPGNLMKQLIPKEKPGGGGGDCRHLIVVPGPNDELDISTKGNWSYFGSLKVITTQKYSNRFENDVEKWPLLIVLTINFDPQKFYCIGK